MKLFEKFPLGTLPFFAVFGRKRNCIIFQYGFIESPFKKTGGGRVLKLFNTLSNNAQKVRASFSETGNHGVVKAIDSQPSIRQ